MNEQSAFIINEESHKKIVKENEEKKRKEQKRKNKNARQRAYYHRQKDLKKNEEIIKTVPKSNAERQRKFRQRNAEKLKRRKLCSNEKNIVRCSAVENIENVTLQENQFHSQQLHIYEQRNECITPEVILHRNTGIPGDGNCLFHSLISVLQLQIESCDLRNQLRDSPYLNSCHNPQEAYNILSSRNDYGNLDCLYLFSKMYNQNICVHYCFYNITTTNEDTIFCHFIANDTQNWIHLHLREQHFTPFYEVSDLLEAVQDATQNEAHVDANIELLRDNYDEDPTEDNHNNHENEIEIDREDRIGENNMDFIDDSTIPVYSNYRKHSTSHIDFYNKFTSNSFGHSCMISDRLWWKGDLKKSTSLHESILKTIVQIMMASHHTSDFTNEYLEDSAIKKESDLSEEHGDIEVKTELESAHNDSICNNEENPNPFQNIQVQVKQEIISMNIEQDSADSSDESMKPCDVVNSNFNVQNITASTKTEEEEADPRLEVKNEMVMGDESLVTYDYPNFDDTGSIDSNDAAALSHVEACLHDEINIKYEDGNYDETYKGQAGKCNIKEETELTVTETHLISNKLINTTSTITSPRGGLIESQTTKTLVMEILPMTRSANVPLSKIGNPEEILPTTNNDYKMDYEDTFQLNSITGNVLSLEQEAYGLLKAKKNTDLVEKDQECPKCPKVFKTKYQVNRHLKIHDAIDRRAMGVIKGVQTRIKNRKKVKYEEETEEMKAKEKLKKEGYECTCGNIFQRRSRMETCLRSHDLFSDTSSFPCITCSKKFKCKEELVLHRKRLHRKRFPCKFCPTDYNTRKELFKHLQIHQKVQLMEYKVISEVVKSKKKLRCFMCFKSYSELSDLKSHVMDDHKEPYSCPRCKLTFPKIIDFGHHTKTSHPEVEGQSVLDVLEAFSKLVKAWKCEECGLQFHEADKLALHQVEKHSPDVKSETQFQCADCRRVFISQKGLMSHRRVHHNTESVEEAEPVEKGVMCLECRKMCVDMSALTSHMRLHSPDRKYPCKYCDFRFANPEKRKAHSEIHTGDMKYVCFICEYQCSSENRLKQHKMSLKHANMKEYLLTGKPLLEEQSTSQKEKIRDSVKVKKKKREKDREMSDSSDTEVSEVACDVCGDKFPNETKMQTHKQTHPFIEFPNEDKPTRIFFK